MSDDLKERLRAQGREAFSPRTGAGQMSELVMQAIINELKEQKEQNDVFLRDDGNGWWTIDGFVNVTAVADAAMRAAAARIEALEVTLMNELGLRDKHDRERIDTILKQAARIEALEAALREIIDLRFAPSLGYAEAVGIARAALASPVSSTQRKGGRMCPYCFGLGKIEALAPEQDK